jgi:hypothetical protein
MDTRDAPLEYVLADHPRGALALSLTSVSNSVHLYMYTYTPDMQLERALTFYTTGISTINKKPVAGQFSEANWWNKTTAYSASIKSAIGPITWNRILVGARKAEPRLTGQNPTRTDAVDEGDERAMMSAME